MDKSIVKKAKLDSAGISASTSTNANSIFFRRFVSCDSYENH